MNEPKIRLKGFSGEWKPYTLNSISSRYDNLRIPIKESQRISGDIPYYGANGIQDYVSGYTHDGEYILIAEDGASDLEHYPVQYVNGKVWVNNHAHVLQGNPDYSSTIFLKYAISCLDIKSVLVGGSRSKLNLAALMGLTVNLPSKEEQEAIASYFKHLDSLIQSTTKKIESLKQVKAASLQSMFPQEGETTPRVRFKGFEGEWEKVSLKKYAKRINRKNKNMESTLALTISSIEGLVSQIDYFNNLVVGANLANYYLLKKGEFAYNKSYSRGYPFGSVKRLDRYEQGILSTLYIVFSINEEISSDYLARFFDTTLWHKQVAERAEEGARNHGLLNIGADDFMSIDIVVPQSMEEQKAVASYFTNLDTQITLQTQRLEKLKQIKSACLDNMFV